MPKEIERKFLVKNDNWQGLGPGVLYRQGYLSIKKEHTVRVRVANQKGFLTVKGPSESATRLEYEYEIPLVEALEILDDLCLKPLIDKIRYEIRVGSLIWYVDQFAGENEGLIVAEVELKDQDQNLHLPEWIGEEVTGDPRYYNSNLIRFPYSRWKEK
jgi:adenylate cyclase